MFAAARGFAASLAPGLIAFELALAVAVLVLAGVLLRSVAGLNRIEPASCQMALITFSVALPEANYQKAGADRGGSRTLVRELGGGAVWEGRSAARCRLARATTVASSSRARGPRSPDINRRSFIRSRLALLKRCG